MKKGVFICALLAGFSICLADSNNYYYNSNGTTNGKSTSNGNNTYYYHSNGTSAGKAVTNGSTTYYYNANGTSAGKSNSSSAPNTLPPQLRPGR